MPNERFPTKGEVLRACRGVDHAGHPMLRAAYALTTLHERRLFEGADPHTDGRSAGLVHEIDHWVRRQLPPTHTATAVHTESIGAIVDRIAAYTATTYAALAAGSPDRLATERQRLAALATTYEHLTDDVVAGRRRLP
ncbi:DUF4254 domain-containing protein [Nocardia bovistercoris]